MERCGTSGVLYRVGYAWADKLGEIIFAGTTIHEGIVLMPFQLGRSKKWGKLSIIRMVLEKPSVSGRLFACLLAIFANFGTDVNTTSRRLADRKSAKFQKNITKRGSVPETTVKKGNDYPVGPIVLGFFIFVVIGSFYLAKMLDRPIEQCSFSLHYLLGSTISGLHGLLADLYLAKM
ncbi:hypothetical protein C2845_PM05G16570 [Panicum miliaceum]|uniref:Uncharacterized protein n=1 Tax=Panicum miliaceum TaxID=4540 RepID=A0A3L6SZC9_PANMI|nr:hypothetical protein C2845_PM05G16570 [Panicum miliaceum]